MRRLLPLLWTVVCAPIPAFGLAAGCGETVIVRNGAEGGGGSTGTWSQGGSSGALPDAGHDALDEYVDPGCPNQEPPVVDFECDPYKQLSRQCAPGEGCYIFVQYPQEPCGQQVYGSFCQPAGTGRQGDSCNGETDCEAGFVCVVTGSGDQCVRLCPLQGPDGCPPGLVCESIDVESFGGCF
jgi:hypothetical protein